MIYLTRLMTLTRTGRATPDRPIWAWLMVLAVPTLLLVLFSPYRAALSHPFGPVGTEARWVERERLQGFVNALHAEGAVQAMAPCQGAEICVRVTDLFRKLDSSDKHSVGLGIQGYFETLPGNARLVSGVRFLDARTGVPLGRFAHGRLD